MKNSGNLKICHVSGRFFFVAFPVRITELVLIPLCSFDKVSSMKHDAEFEKRCLESRRILSKYPDRVPVIVERNPRAKNSLPEIEKKKFLVPVCYYLLISVSFMNRALCFVVNSSI